MDAGCKSSIPEKNKCSPDSDCDEWFEAESNACIAEDDTIQSLSGITDATSSNFLKRIWAVQSSKDSYDGPAHIKDVLQVGEQYDVVSIKGASTRHGPIQIWTFKCLKDDTLKRVFSCADLHRFTSDNYGRLDREKRREMIKNARIRYKGYQKLQRNMYSKYEFEFLQK